jgi:hypothetical protein
MDNIFVAMYDDCVDVTSKCGTECKVLSVLCVTSTILIPSGIAVGLYLDYTAGLVVFCIGASLGFTIVFYFTLACIGKCVKWCDKPPLLPLTRG